MSSISVLAKSETNQSAWRRIKPTLFLVLVAVSVLRSAREVSAIKCYLCQSNVDPKCADPFDNLTLPLTDCDSYMRADLVPRTEFDLLEEKSFFLSTNQQAPVKPLKATMCRKARQKVNGEWRTIRGCGYLRSSPSDDSTAGSKLSDDELNRCQIRYGTNEIFMESCACNSKDGCNRATTQRQTGAYGSRPFTILAPVALTLFICLSELLAKSR